MDVPLGIQFLNDSRAFALLHFWLFIMIGFDAIIDNVWRLGFNMTTPCQK